MRNLTNPKKIKGQDKLNRIKKAEFRTHSGGVWNNNNNQYQETFTYDANGNMITNTNKGITAITYNHLNFPKKVTFNTGDQQRSVF